MSTDISRKILDCLPGTIEELYLEISLSEDISFAKLKNSLDSLAESNTIIKSNNEIWSKKMKIRLINPRNNVHYDLKIDLSWTLFFFWNCFGLPFWMRKMPVWAIGCIVVQFFIGGLFESNSGSMVLFGFLLHFIMATLLLFRGNELTKNYLLDKGWVIESIEAKHIRESREYKSATI